MKKIALVGSPNVKNYGDPILFEATKYLLEQLGEDGTTTIEILDLFGENSIWKGKQWFIWGVHWLLDLLYKKRNKNTRIYYFMEKALIELEVSHYFKKKLIGVDSLVFAGGGLLKYKYETFDYRISILIRLAQQRNIPVILSGVGVEGYSQNNIRCQEMKKVINVPVVQCITTRDDIDLLTKKYITNSRIQTAKVADPAFWTREVYGITKKVSNIVGLGVVRSKIFFDNGVPVTEEEFLQLWCDLIDELDRRKVNWTLFTNGLDADQQFVDLLLDKLNRLEEKEHLVKTPNSPRELVEIVSAFDRVLVCRMHAAIIAYSLEIPVVGLVWNEKIKMFGETIGRASCFFQYKEFEPIKIVDTLMEQKMTEKDIEFKNAYKQTTVKVLKKILSSGV